MPEGLYSGFRGAAVDYLPCKGAGSRAAFFPLCEGVFIFVPFQASHIKSI